MLTNAKSEQVSKATHHLKSKEWTMLAKAKASKQSHSPAEE